MFVAIVSLLTAFTAILFENKNTGNFKSQTGDSVLKQLIAFQRLALAF